VTATKSFFFDISTAARWSGHPVGIVRVEREIASRARERLGDRAAYCLYDIKSGAFKALKAEYVPDILAGDLCIDFQDTGGNSKPSASHALRIAIRDFALEIPVLFQFLQRLRGRSFSIEEIRTIRQTLKQSREDPSHLQNRLPLNDVTNGCVALNESTAIISGGLDWEHKEMRAIYHLKEKLGFKYIPIIYDLIPIKMPHYVVPHYVNLLTEYFGELIWTADACLCISETTRMEFADYCRENGAAPPPSLSFPLGSNPPEDASDLDEFPPELDNKNYVLFVSTIEPRKNHRTIYNAWCHALLNEMVDPVTDRLVFVGRQGWLVGDLLHEMSTNAMTRESIVILSDVSDSLLAALYRKSAFTIFPSFYEGFGLPLAEALSYGKACVTSGAGALAEIGSDFRVDVDARDTLGWARKISELLANPEIVATMERSIRTNYKPVSWDDSADIFFSSLQRIAT
jgi:glycosyltransferase involved in cell wall biosynthesis